jgi:tetrahydromethanopterin S-methyltransferase subunit G
MTIAKALDWIQYPVPLNVIGNKWLWDCDGLDFDYDQECDFIDQSAKHAEEEKIKQKKAKMDQEFGENLYRNGVLSGVIIAFGLAILFIILYDRYN